MELDDGTVPLDNQWNNTVDIHGRLYQQYSVENNLYLLPCDEQEIERLESMNTVLNAVVGDKLILPTLESPTKILDCGTGTGDWAIAVAQQYPECQVLGIELNPHLLPDDLPSNLTMQIDDLNGRFTFTANSFDLVHSRIVADGIDSTRWQNYLRDIHRVIKPDGYCQMVELYMNAQSDNGTLASDNALSQWSAGYLLGAETRKDPRAGTRLGNLLSNAGFVDMRCQLLKLPMSGWSNDPKERHVGNLNADLVKPMLYALGLFHFTEKHGMSPQDFEDLVNRAVEEAQNPSYKAYFAM